MSICINTNSAQYQSLKNKAGMPEFIFEAICRGFMERHGRLPYLDELPNSNSEPYLRELLGVTKNDSVKIDSLLEMTGKETVLEAVIDINNQFRDLETTVVPIVEEALIDITHRPTDNNFDNLTEEEKILTEAPRDSRGNLLAPNGKISNLTESQYVQVRTKAFKNWFGDWINNPENASKVVDENGEPLVVYHSTNKEYAGFNKIDFNKSDDKKSFFTTDNKNMSKSYTSPVNIVNKPKEFDEIFNELFNVDEHGLYYNVPTDDISSFYSQVVYTNEITTDELIEIIDNNIDYENLKLLELIDNLYVVSNTNNENFKRIFDNYSEEDIIKDRIDNNNKSIEKIKNTINNLESLKQYVKDNNTRVEYVDKKPDKYTYELFVNVRNPLIIDAGYAQPWNNIIYDKKRGFIGTQTTRTLVDLAIKNGHDGYIAKHITDFGAYSESGDDVEIVKGNYGDRDYIETPVTGTVITVLNNSNQIKSATSNSGLFSRANNDIYDPTPDGYLVLNNALQKLAALYGITFNEISDDELNSEKWHNLIPDASLVNAFIYNGLIYINLDRANLDAPIHEMFHMFVGSLRFTNPNLYLSLVESVQSFPNYEKLALEYLGRTRNDVNEEILVTEVSKYLSGYPSSLTGMDDKIRYEISYNIKRMLDTVLMGLDSVKTISEDKLFNLSLKEIAQEVNSAVMTNTFAGTMNVEGSELHRRLNNIKSELYKEGTLEENCDL